MSLEAAIAKFDGPGKKYHGVRYPGGDIRQPNKVVMVLPEDGQAYELIRNGKVKHIAESFEWGNLLPTLGKAEPVEQRCIYEKKAAFIEKVRKRSEAQWKRIEIAQKRCQQLAISILMDFLDNAKVAELCYKHFSGLVIEKLPESEWWLTGKEIEDAIGARIVIAGLSTLGGNQP